MITATTAFKRVGKLKHKNKVIQGSQGAGKTFSILLIWILKALKSKEPQHCSIVTATFPALRDGALKDFFTVCKLLGIEIQGTKTPAVYKIGLWTFQFFSVDKENKGLGSRRDRLFINEANRMPWTIARQLINRTHKERIVDFNPVSEFWAHTQFVNVGDCDFLKLTYKDNEALPLTEVESIEKHAPWGILPDANFWRVYGLGEIGIQEGCIYENWKEGEFDYSLPFVWGMDFGYVNDPTTLVRVAKDKHNIYIQEHLYDKGLSTMQIYERIKEIVKDEEVIIADNSEPRLIGELQEMGILIYPCIKGRDSIRAGIAAIKEYMIIADPNSFNLKTELNNYCWNPKLSNVPMDDYNHGCDAFRYAFDELDHKSEFFIG